uniref:Peptidoglycan binding-like domain-containing protein n=1 Tax=Romanomermis culicivorax TaxID=13658 RepID=A0A915HYN7_ROMCU
MKSKFAIVETMEWTSAGLIRCLICVILLNNSAAAVPPSLSKKLIDGSGPYDDYTQEYLTQFGYLPRGNREMSNLRKDDSIQLALMRLQDFAGLRPTGLVDHETRKLLLRKRCGLPDVPFDGSGGHLTPRDRRHDEDQAINDGVDVRQRRRLRRVKRYVLHGSKWDNLNVTYK